MCSRPHSNSPKRWTRARWSGWGCSVALTVADLPDTAAVRHARPVGLRLAGAPHHSGEHHARLYFHRDRGPWRRGAGDRPQEDVLMFTARTRFALTVVLALSAAGLISGAAVAQAPKPGNSPNAKLCQKNGWDKTVVSATGESFTSEKQCTSYAAQGGKLVLKEVIKPCLQNGWQNWVTSSGASFASEAACRTYAAAGNVLYPPHRSASRCRAATRSPTPRTAGSCNAAHRPSDRAWTPTAAGTFNALSTWTDVP